MKVFAKKVPQMKEQIKIMMIYVKTILCKMCNMLPFRKKQQHYILSFPYADVMSL